MQFIRRKKSAKPIGHKKGDLTQKSPIYYIKYVYASQRCIWRPLLCELLPLEREPASREGRVLRPGLL